MNKEEVQAKLKDFFVSNIGVDADALQYDTPLFGDEIGLDSVDAMEIISFIDEEFELSITDFSEAKFPAISDIADYIIANVESN